MSADQPYATSAERELLRLQTEVREEIRDIRRGLLSREVYEANRMADQSRLTAIETQLAHLNTFTAAAAATEARLKTVEQNQQASSGMGRGLVLTIVAGVVLQGLAAFLTRL